MTSAARAAEADQTAATYYTALTAIGASSIQDALRLWGRVPPTRRAGTGAAWLAKAVHLVLTRRSRSRELALAYYRLVRALRTGSTVADPRRPEPQHVSLGTLRREFAALAGAQPSPAVPPEVSEAAAEGEPEAPDDDADEVLVEQIDALDRELERLERTAEAEAQIILDELGTKNLDRKLDDIDTSAPAAQVDDEREDAHRRAGTRQAAATERLVLNGGRGTLWTLTEQDRRALGWARMSRTGTPCGWCAMLISRGAVYKNARTATYADGDAYHDNCHCYAEPLFDREQTASPRFALNREYGRLWPQVTRGLSGKAALRAWRRFIRDQKKSSAQAAEPIAQEA